MSKNIINLGIAGLGWMGTLHFRSIPQESGIRVTAMYDIDPERVEFGRENGLKAYSNLEAFLGDSDIDAVLVATPNNVHKELAVASLKAGKHVISEKPAVLNTEELEEIIQASHESGKLFTVHHNRRWDRDYLAIKRTIESGKIGEPFYIESRVQAANGIANEWRKHKEFGGGLLYDWGVHLIDQVLNLVDSPVTEVYAHLLSVHYKDVDDNSRVILKFENGLSALIQMDTSVFNKLPRWHVSGETGTVVIAGFDGEGSVVTGNVEEVVWKPDMKSNTIGPSRTMAYRPGDKKEDVHPATEFDSNSWIHFYSNVKAAIDGAEELKIKPEECLRVTRIIDAAFKSSAEGVAVKGKF